ncbi:MAG: hypothetical protein WD154_04800 [Nitrosopumilaceae archaeon]
MSTQINKKKGRPTKQEQKELKEKIQQYHEKHYSATSTHRKTGINIKTVLKYFNEWDNKLLESSDNDFLKRCKVAREKGIITIEEEIESLTRQEILVDEIRQKCIEAGDLQNIVKYYKLNLNIKELKAKFLAQKINLVCTPTYDTILELNSKVDKQ